MKKVISFLLRHEYLIWILCFCAFLRLPSLLEPYWYGDEGIYLTLGTAIRQGMTLYRDIHDNKPPLLYLLAALSNSVFWFRFLLLVWNSVAIVAFERLSHLLLDSKEDPGKTKIMGVDFPNVSYSTIATALFALLPFFAEGAIANGEIFMVMPVIVSMYILWKQMKTNTWKTSLIALSGFLFSVAFLIKVPSLFDAAAAGFFFFVLVPILALRKSSLSIRWQTLLLPIVTFSVAFLLPLVVSFVYYQSKGVGKEYVSAAFAQNIGYLSSWSTGTHKTENLGSSGLRNRAIALGAALIVLSVGAVKNGKKLTFLLIWFACTLFGALLAERPYPHYLIQVIPPAALLLVFTVKTLKERVSKVYLVQVGFVILAGGVFLLSLWKIHFWYYPLLPYYSNYLSFVTGQQTKEEYFSYFDRRLPAMYAVASQIASSTTPADKIFVWGDYPMIYALSHRLPPGKYTSSYHIKDFNGVDQTVAAMEKNPPAFIVIDTLYEAPFSQLSTILDDQYVRADSYGTFALYKRFQAK